MVEFHHPEVERNNSYVCCCCCFPQQSTFFRYETRTIGTCGWCKTDRI